jgi:hypothetical protein
MVKRVFVLLAIVMLAACKGGNKGPVLANPSEEIDYNQDATEHVANITSEKKDVDIQHDEGILSIAEVFKNRENLSGKIVTVKGEVTKYNPAIMGRNWVHIQDGTDFSGEFDLTITTSAEVAVGDQVVFSGVLATDRDFGYGYRYSTIVEGAELKK